MEILNPSHWPRPSGYNNAIKARRGSIIFIAGQVAWDASQCIVSDDLVVQFGQVFHNILTVVRTAGAVATDITRMTLYVTDKNDYLARQKEIGIEYRKHFGDHYPAMTLVEVKSLLEEGAQVEIECTAVIERD